MYNIYSLCASQEVQPLQNIIQIIYDFVQIHKLDEAVSPTTPENISWIWWVVDT